MHHGGPVLPRGLVVSDSSSFPSSSLSPQSTPPTPNLLQSSLYNLGIGNRVPSPPSFPWRRLSSNPDGWYQSLPSYIPWFHVKVLIWYCPPLVFSSDSVSLCVLTWRLTFWSWTPEVVARVVQCSLGILWFRPALVVSILFGTVVRSSWFLD